MASTASKAIPYPVATDTPDVPRDLNALASRVDALLGTAEPVAAATDLNTLTTSGTYYVADAGTNSPEAVAGWHVVVSRASSTVVRQIATHSGDATGSKVWARYMTGGTWGSWLVVAPRRASGQVSVTPPAANTGQSVAVTFPAGRFTATPRVFVNAQSNGYGCGSAGAVTSSGFTARYYNPTATVPTSPTLEWIAEQD